MAPRSLQLIQWNEHAIGANHPNAAADASWADVANRPLRNLIAYSGGDPDAFTGLPAPVFNILNYATSDTNRDEILAGTAECGTALTAAVTDAIAAGRGIVELPPGDLLLGPTGLTMTTQFRVYIRGHGAELTRLRYTGTGAALKVFRGAYHVLSDFTVDVGTSATAIGVHLLADSSGWVQWNEFHSVRVVASALVAGQVGWKLESTGSGNITFNTFVRPHTFNIDRPFVLDTVEANDFISAHVSDFGATGLGTPIAIESNGSTDNWLGVWVGANPSLPVGDRLCMRFTGECNNALGVIGDIGQGSVFYDSGTNNNLLGTARGTTQWGSRPGTVNHRLGTMMDVGTATVNVVNNAGADRDMVLVGINGITNGLHVRYTHATQRMTYEMLSGEIRLEDATGPLIRAGSGSPEGSVTAPVGSLYTDSTGGKLYVKATGTGDTGWVVAGTQT
jgi:hypothetical protein